MEVISLIGILLGIVTFVIMLTKRFNLVLSGCLANATSVGKVPFLKGASVYMWISWVGGGLALLVSLLLIQAGVFV